jgi:hypothetical protein
VFKESPGNSPRMAHPTKSPAEQVREAERATKSPVEQVYKMKRATKSTTEQIHEVKRTTKSPAEQVYETERATKSPVERVCEVERGTKSSAEQVQALSQSHKHTSTMTMCDARSPGVKHKHNNPVRDDLRTGVSTLAGRAERQDRVPHRMDKSMSRRTWGPRWWKGTMSCQSSLGLNHGTRRT